MANEDDHLDYLFKLVIVGDSGVGKTSLLLRYVDQVFSETYISTIGVDFKIRTLVINGKRIKLQIWDTAGQERFKHIVSTFYRNANSVILVYDVTDSDTYLSVQQKWLSDVNNYAGNKVRRVLVGNKCDLTSSRQVPAESGRAFAESIGMMHIETSAKTAENLDKLFIDLVVDLMEVFEPLQNTQTVDGASFRPTTLPDGHPVPSGGICNC